GETHYNREKLLQQGVDTVLSEAGVQQGEAVGRYLRDIKFSQVFVSNLQRTTAELILRNSTHCCGMEMVLEPLLRERCFGVAEGHPKEDLKNMANAAGQSYREYTPPGGETTDQVRLRFIRFLKVLYKQMLDEHGWSTPDASQAPDCANRTDAAAPDGTAGGAADDGLQGVSVHALVVSHGTYIHVAVRHLVEGLNCSLPAGVKMSRVFSPCPNTGIARFILTLSKSDTSPVLSAARCVFTNRKDHLE
uniref:Fructose-2,6-bisphosphatase TIGAR B n=1 Tax=Mola mola TaxID=94237 RepID=A0A3Q3VS87_MOLML